jgi:acyl-CoA thioesterase-1
MSENVSALLLFLLLTAPVRYLALGDSFTAGTGATPTEAFPARLVERWKQAGLEVTFENRAVNGATSQDVLMRQMDDVKTFNATFVTLLIGANDLVRGANIGTYRAQLRRILTKLQDNGVALKKICLLPQPHWTASPTGSTFGVTGETINAWNEVVKEVAAINGCCFIDLFPLMNKQAQSSKRVWSEDGLHPNAAAYDAWAAELFKSLPLAQPKGQKPKT